MVDTYDILSSWRVARMTYILTEILRICLAVGTVRVLRFIYEKGISRRRSSPTDGLAEEIVYPSVSPKDGAEAPSRRVVKTFHLRSRESPHSLARRKPSLRVSRLSDTIWYYYRRII